MTKRLTNASSATVAKISRAARSTICVASSGKSSPTAQRVAQFLGACDLDQPAMVHHRDAVRHGKRFGLVVGDEHGRDPQPPLEGANFAAHLAAQGGIQIGQRFVKQQQIGFDHARARQRHALLLAAGKLGGEARRKRPQAHKIERLRCALGAHGGFDMAHLRPKATLSATLRCANSA